MLILCRVLILPRLAWLIFLILLVDVRSTQIHRVGSKTLSLKIIALNFKLIEFTEPSCLPFFISSIYKYEDEQWNIISWIIPKFSLWSIMHFGDPLNDICNQYASVVAQLAIYESINWRSAKYECSRSYSNRFQIYWNVFRIVCWWHWFSNIER